MDKQLTAVLLTLLIFGIIILVMGLVIAAAVVRNKREKERTLQLQSTASFLGLEFLASSPLNWISNLETFALFSQGHSKSISNVMYGQIDGVKAALFDYQYSVGHGKHRSTFNQSVVYFEPRNLSLPSFSLRPENTFHKIISAFGYQDIDFANRPEFSAKYLLRGADEQAIRGVFNASALGFYEANQETCTDGGGNQLFVFKQNHRVAPLEAQAFINWAVGVKNLFASRWCERVP